MPFSDLSAAQRKFLATHTKSGKQLAQSALTPPVDPHEEEREAWLAKVAVLESHIKAAPPALDTSKLQLALDKTRSIYEEDFVPKPAQKALKTIQAAFAKASGETTAETKDTLALLTSVRADFTALQKLAFPDKKPISAKILGLLTQAKSESDKGDFAHAERLIQSAETQIASARIGVDAKTAKDLKPADLKVLMKTQDGQAQLDAIVDNLTDDVPPNVMMSILEARFSLDRRLVQSNFDRENSMFDKAKHGAMLETDSPKLRKFYKKLMADQESEKNAAE